MDMKPGLHNPKVLLRDTFIDAVNDPDFNATDAYFKFVYADIISFASGGAVSIDVPAGGAITLSARVITSDQALTLNFKPTSADLSAVILDAAVLDQPIAITFRGTVIDLELGPYTPNKGVQLEFSNGSLNLTYRTQYDPFTRVNVEGPGREALRCVETQLRAASILYWLWPSVARSLASYVADVTSNSNDYASLGLQAVALGQQLSADKLTGTGLNYAPALVLENYIESTTSAIAVVSAYETQFDRFTDKKATVEDQKQAWDTMYAKAQDDVSVQQTLCDSALSKWKGALDASSRIEFDFRAHQIAIQSAQLEFQAGIQAWKTNTEFEVAFKIITAAMSKSRPLIFDLHILIYVCVTAFAVAIGAMSVGDPAEGVKAEQAAEDVAKASKEVQEMAENMKKLKDFSDAVNALIDSTTDVVGIMQTLASNPGSSVPQMPSTVSSANDLEIEKLETLAAWDKWQLDADNQLEVAIDNNIDGASDYRLELRKHAVDGKLLCQARTEAIKAGQEYTQLSMTLFVAQANLKRLAQLRKNYQGEIDKYQEAEAHFYDRIMMHRTGVAVNLRNGVWAYTYRTLTTSSVSVNPLKDTVDLQADLLQLQQELQNWETELPSPPARKYQHTPSTRISEGPRLTVTAFRGLLLEASQVGCAPCSMLYE
jgi:hypothetical protein